MSDSVLIHSDNVTEFANRDYYNFVNNHPYLIGSTSITGHPEHNSVMESGIKTFKLGMPNHKINNTTFNFPDTVKTTQQLQTIVNNRVKYYNEVYNTKYNGKLTTSEKELKYEVSEIEQPVVTLTRRDSIKPYNENYLTVSNYHKQLHQEEPTDDVKDKIINNC